MRKLIIHLLLGTFFAFSIGPLPSYAEIEAEANAALRPVLDQKVVTVPTFGASLKGLTIHPENPLQFGFIVEPPVTAQSLKDESLKLIKYFLASLTIPEQDMWVNLSPYEKNRIVPESFGQTLMGRDLLAQDYLLKQITASLIHPDTALGKEFWAKVYKQAQAKFGTTNIPINTFNKVWIMPDKATVWERSNGSTNSPQISAFVVERHLKVMLEEDYLALNKNSPPLEGGVSGGGASVVASQIVRDIIIPTLEKQVNEDESFAQLREIYNAMILATWFKKQMKQTLLAQAYVDKNKVAGIHYSLPPVGRAREGQYNQTPNEIYQQYIKLFKKGLFNFIKEEPDPITGQLIPRKYFSGGMRPVHDCTVLSLPLKDLSRNLQAQLPGSKAMMVIADAIDPPLKINGNYAIGSFVEMAIQNELPSALRTLEVIIKLREHMDLIGDKDKPLVVWQNLRLGTMYPFFSENLKRALGFDEGAFIDEQMITQWTGGVVVSENLKKKRLILMHAKVPSTPGDEGRLRLDADRLNDLSAQLNGAKILMIDHSPHIVSGAQRRIFSRASTPWSWTPLRVKDEVSLNNVLQKSQYPQIYIYNASSKEHFEGDRKSTFEEAVLLPMEQITEDEQKGIFLRMVQARFGQVIDSAILKSEDPVFKGIRERLKAASSTPAMTATEKKALAQASPAMRTDVFFEADGVTATMIREDTRPIILVVSDQVDDHYLFKELMGQADQQERFKEYRFVFAKTLNKAQEMVVRASKTHKLAGIITKGRFSVTGDPRELARDAGIELIKFTQTLSPSTPIILNAENERIALVAQSVLPRNQIKQDDFLLDAVIKEMSQRIPLAQPVHNNLSAEDTIPVNNIKEEVTKALVQLRGMAGQIKSVINNIGVDLEKIRLSDNAGDVSRVMDALPQQMDIVMNLIDQLKLPLPSLFPRFNEQDGWYFSSRSHHGAVYDMSDKWAKMDYDIKLLKPLPIDHDWKEMFALIHEAYQQYDQMLGDILDPNLSTIPRIPNAHAESAGVPSDIYLEFLNPAKKVLLGDTGDLGGIDLNAKHLDLSIKRDAQGVPLPFAQQDWAQIHINGLEPVIVKMEPVNLQELLGTNP